MTTAAPPSPPLAPRHDLEEDDEEEGGEDTGEDDEAGSMDDDMEEAANAGSVGIYSFGRRHSDMVMALLIVWTPSDLAAMLKLVLQAVDFGHEHWQGAGDQLHQSWVPLPTCFDDTANDEDTPREDMTWTDAIYHLAQLTPMETPMYRTWARIAILVALWLNEAVRLLFAASDARIRARFHARCLGPDRLRSVLDTVREELGVFAADRAYRGADDFLIACGARILHGMAPATVLDTPARRALMARLLQLSVEQRTTQ